MLRSLATRASSALAGAARTSSHDWDACGFGAAQLRQLPQSPPLPSLAGPRTLHSCYPTASHDSKQSMNSTLPQPQQHTEEMQEQHAAQSSFGGSSTSLAAAAAKPFSRDGRQTITGYPESHLYVAVSDTPAAAAGGSGGQPTAPPLLPLVPPEVLRIALRQEVQQEIEHKTLNAYSLSRSLVDSGTPEQQQQRRRQQQQQDGRVEEAASSHSAAGGAAAHAAPLSQDDAAVLNKLVGVLMKDGKKARARRILVDAMHIIKQQLARDASGGGGSADR